MFFLCYSLTRHENPLEIFPYGDPPASHRKNRQIDAPFPLENPIPSVGGGGDMDIFSNHTLHVLTPFFFNIFLSDLSAVIWTVFKLYEVILFLLQLNWIVWPINSISLHGYLKKNLPNILFDLFLSLTCCLSYNFL